MRATPLLPLVFALACGGRTQLRGTLGDSGAPTPGQQIGGDVLPACAPNDAPAYQFSFGTPAPTCPSSASGDQSVLIEIWAPLPAGPGTYTLGDGSLASGGGAFVCTGPGVCSAASQGTLVLTEFSTTSASGSYDLVMPDGTTVAASFSSVPVCSQLRMCG